MLNGFHHVAIICSDYPRSKQFYTEILGFSVIAENYRESAPTRPSRPEAQGLRHLAFKVDDLDAAIQKLTDKGVECEPIRVDEYTDKRFTFFQDPDGLPLELYEVAL